MPIILENVNMCASTIRNPNAESRIELVETLGYVTDSGEACVLYDASRFKPGRQITCANIWLLKSGYETVGTFASKAAALAAYDEIIGKLKADSANVYISVKDDSPAAREVRVDDDSD